MKADVERLREKKNASDSDTVIPADCEAIEVFDYLTNVPRDPEFLLEGLIYKGTVTQLMGVIKSGKTALARDLPKGAARRQAFHGAEDCSGKRAVCIRAGARFVIKATSGSRPEKEIS